VKELTLQEVLQIAGGIPSAAALDELSYGSNAEAAAPEETNPGAGIAA
jgi:hypothetical protein